MKVLIDSYSIIEEIEYPHLSKFKKFICRLFKIIPEIRYIYIISVSGNWLYVPINSIWMDTYGQSWKVLTSHDVRNGTVLKNLTPIFKRSLHGEYGCVVQLFSEHQSSII